MNVNRKDSFYTGFLMPEIWVLAFPVNQKMIFQNNIDRITIIAIIRLRSVKTYFM